MRLLIIKVGEALYGASFQRALASDLGVNERTMRRWVAGDSAPPESVRDDLRELIFKRRIALTELLRRV